MPTKSLTITLSRPGADAKLGLTLSSTSEDDPPFVKKLAGIAESSQLRVGDIITAVNGTPVHNSQSATQLIAGSGAQIAFVVSRDEGAEVVVDLRRGGKSLGLVMDARNAIVELVPDSAAATHGGIMPGDRIMGINGTSVAPGENIVSLFPQGEALIQLTLLRVEPEAGRTTSIDVPFSQTGAIAPSGFTVPQSGFTNAERAMLREVFVELGGTDEMPISATTAFAAYTHFRPDANLEEVKALARRATGKDGPLSFDSFCSLMLLVRAGHSTAHVTYNLIDRNGLGGVSLKDAATRLKALHQGIDASHITSNDLTADIDAMLAALPIGSNGLVSRADFVSIISN